MQVVVVIAGGIGIAIARRQGSGKHILLADFNQELLEKAAKALGELQGLYAKIEFSSRESVRSLANAVCTLGSVVQVVNTAGVSPNMAPPNESSLSICMAALLCLRVQAGHRSWRCRAHHLQHGRSYVSRFSTRAGSCLSFTAAEELLQLPFLSAEAVPNSMVAYILAKRANCVQAESIKWGERGARVNSISPGIIATPLAQHELSSAIRGLLRSNRRQFGQSLRLP